MRFDDDSVARGYDRGLVPVIFEPWAARLVAEHGPWQGRRVLDLATGTGVVAEMLAGRAHEVLGADINGHMLALARERCGEAVTFVESPADALDVVSESRDVVVCQQGFQFFPDKPAAAREIHRVLRKGGKVVVTTWRPVSECQFFGAICDALESIGEIEIAETMRRPFDFMPERELFEAFESAGFTDIRLQRQEQDLVMIGGAAHAIDVAYAAPIRPALLALPEEQQNRFRGALRDILRILSEDGTTMGVMASSELTAIKG